MKSTEITCILVLLAVACTRARNVINPASQPDISSPSFPSGQWNTQDEIGQASFGYSYPGHQAASNVRDSAGNMAGSWAYVNPEGKLVNVSYTADERGFRVSSNVLPAAAAPVADLAVEPVVTGRNPTKAASVPVDSIVNDGDCIGNRPARSKRQTGDETNLGNRNPIASKLEEFNYSNNKYTEETGRNQYPFMAALLKYDEASRRYKLACGGSLISATKILTAAHCVIQNETIPAFDKLLVKLGVHFLNETADDAEVTSRINHDRHSRKLRPTNEDQRHRHCDARLAREIHRQNFDRLPAAKVPSRRSYQRLRPGPWMGKRQGR
ncbi:uncharacterized protein LOC124328546 isoform X2 [Daphnia pulicaria]|uniref:uncharacterized protein LOC124328546 isoform X2 n=1 Tax=Daphnia pulicaria TaxID=35523 RepID=UPI001EEBAAF8|nr:uncharacterized protein LOC124328546 isoform X2 [Daphnia pulicaria]